MKKTIGKSNLSNKRIEVIQFILLMILLLIVNLDYGQSSVVPGLRSFQASGGELALPNHVKLFIDEKDGLPEVKDNVNLFQLELQNVTALTASVDVISKVEKDGVYFKLVPHLDGLNAGKECYRIKVNERIEVQATTVAGFFYAQQTLLQILKQSGGRIKKGVIEDSPNFETRAIMIDCGRRFYQISYLKKIIRQMAWYKLNTLHLHFTEWNGFRLKSEKYPGLAAEEAYSKADIEDLQNYASQYFVDIVPEIDLPAHATAITNYNPELAFSCESMRKARWQGAEADSLGKAWALDVTRPEVREWIDGLLEEWIPVFKSKYFHVGGDEYQYDPEKEQCAELMEYAESMGYEKPGDAFIVWLNDVNKKMNAAGKTTQIWNWWRFGKNATSLQPDTNIVVNVWNSPRLQAIIDDGYKVIITPEEELYVSPGLADAEGYGVVDCQKVYEDWEPMMHQNILGYKVCVWSDRAEFESDEWFEAKSFDAKVVLAEKMWSGSKSDSLIQFLERVKLVGEAQR